MLTVERLESRRLLSASRVPILPAGSLDPTFGVEGTTQVTSGLASLSGIVQRDGKVVSADGDFVVRKNPDGSVDATFGVNGTVRLPGTFINTDDPDRLVLEADGRIVIAETVLGGSQLVRLLPAGQLDPSFGTAGVVNMSIGFVNAIEVDGAGNLLVAAGSPGFFLLERYRPDGTLDPGFGTAGIVSLEIPGGAN